MRSAVIPTIFSAVDKITAPVRSMTGSVTQFADRAQAGIARSERTFRRLTPVLSETSKQLLSFASTAAIAGAAFGAVTFSVDSIKDYEKSVASFRTIVSDLTNEEFAGFQDAINKTARDSKKSSVEIAQSFEKIAGLNADFAKTPAQISQVTAAVVTLSKASGDELGPSAESLVGIMNQFGFAANQADRTINVLAAGAGVGAASITQTSEAFVNFGSVAKGANISLEQSVGLIQTLGKFSVFGAEAGTKLRGSILKLTQAGVGYKSGQFSINDALEEARKKIDKLKTAKEKDRAILKLFGAENIATGKILLNNVDQFNKYTEGVSNTKAATLQAAIRSDTLTTKLEELKASWVNMLTGSNKATEGLNLVKSAIGFVTENLSTIISVGSKALLFFVAWKAWIIASKIALVTLRAVSSAFFLVDMIKYVASTQGLSFAQAAWGVITSTVTGEQIALNAAMAANPVGIVVLAVAALAAGIYYLINQYETLKQEYLDEQQKRQIKSFGEEEQAVHSLAARYEKLGMSKKEALSKAITEERSILDQKAADIQKKISTGAGTVGLMGMRTGNISDDEMLALKRQATDISNQRLEVTKMQAGEAGTMPYVSSQTPPLVNPKAENRDAMVDQMTKTNNAEVTLNIKGDTDKVDAKQDKGFVKIKTTSTMGSN